MSLSNYARSRSRRNGGIRLIGLVEQSDVAEVTYASAEKGYSAIRLDEFWEDEAEYRETVSVVNGAQVVTHELIFTLDKMGNDSSPAITSIADAARNGLIALLTTPNGDSFLVGYSVEFEKERPLRLVSANGTTGKHQRKYPAAGKRTKSSRCAAKTFRKPNRSSGIWKRCSPQPDSNRNQRETGAGNERSPVSR